MQDLLDVDIQCNPTPQIDDSGLGGRISVEHRSPRHCASAAVKIRIVGASVVQNDEVRLTMVLVTKVVVQVEADP